jgi:hypothetical protein
VNPQGPAHSSILSPDSRTSPAEGEALGQRAPSGHWVPPGKEGKGRSPWRGSSLRLGARGAGPGPWWPSVGSGAPGVRAAGHAVGAGGAADSGRCRRCAAACSVGSRRTEPPEPELPTCY